MKGKLYPLKKVYCYHCGESIILEYMEYKKAYIGDYKKYFCGLCVGNKKHLIPHEFKNQ